MNTEGFEKLAIADAGWTTLFRDPQSKRLIERRFPSSEMQGGGPPAFVELTLDEARAKYKLENLQGAIDGK